MKTKKLLSVAIALCAIATGASSQTVNTGWYAAPTFNFVIDSPHREDHVGWATGLAIGKVLSERWNIELAGQYSDFGANDNQTSVGLDALYFLNRNRVFSPYASLGLGYVYEGDLPTHDRDKNSRLMLRGGLGFLTQVSKNIDFRMDARYQWHGAKSGAPSLGDWLLSAGINYYF